MGGYRFRGNQTKSFSDSQELEFLQILTEHIIFLWYYYRFLTYLLLAGLQEVAD